ncbi:MAG TPA: hypothetical protein VGV93_07615, partial [Acidimicrobiales bacterium]|nr:hypothetical protein [Acidimicrobiales bacterium]
MTTSAATSVPSSSSRMLSEPSRRARRGLVLVRISTRPSLRFCDELADARLFPVEEAVAALHDGDLHAEVGEEQAGLHADGAAPDQHRPSGQFLGGVGLPVGPRGDLVEALDGWDVRYRPGSEDEVFTTQFPVTELDQSRAGDVG